MSNGDTPPIQPSPDSYTLTDWTQTLHNAAQLKPDHPRYAESRAVIQEALRRIDAIHQQQNASDQANAMPGPIPSAVVGFGQGASLGLASKLGDALPGASNSQYLSQARQANPMATGIGDAVGTAALGTIASPLVAGLSPAAGGAALGGAIGAGRGGVEAGIPGAVAGGAVGALGGGVGGKVLGAAGKVAGKVVGNIGKLVQGEEEQVGGMAVSKLRDILTKQKFGTPDQVEAAINGMRKAVQPAPTPRPQVPGTMGPIAGTGGRGFEVTGERATPPVPTSPTITEIQDAMAGKGSLKDLGKGQTLPYYPRGGQAEQALPPPPQVSAKATTSGDPLRFSPQLQEMRTGIQALKAKIGRDLTTQEREAVLQHYFGPQATLPR